MLRFLSSGARNFGRYPMAQVSRINWEFYAVVEGRAAPLFESKAQPALHETTLWVFPPENVHGWTGNMSPCEVVVFHFGSVPPPLEQLVRERQYLAHKLRPDQVTRIRELAVELEPHFREPNQLSHLHFQRAVLELALMVLADVPPLRLSTLPNQAQDKVEAAIMAYYERIADHPTIEDIAELVHVSPSYLRRLFLQVRQENPRDVFRRIALERAMELMSQTKLTLDDIANQCGFAGASEFSRAFRKQYKVPPAVWRAGILPPYRDPVSLGPGKFEYPGVHDQVVRKISRYTGAYRHAHGNS